MVLRLFIYALAALAIFIMPLFHTVKHLLPGPQKYSHFSVKEAIDPYLNQGYVLFSFPDLTIAPFVERMKQDHKGRKEFAQAYWTLPYDRHLDSHTFKNVQGLACLIERLGQEETPIIWALEDRFTRPVEGQPNRFIFPYRTHLGEVWSIFEIKEKVYEYDKGFFAIVDVIAIAPQWPSTDEHPGFKDGKSLMPCQTAS